MNKKYLKDMSVEELKKVFNSNEQLRNDILDDMIDTEMFYIDEYLSFIRDSLSNWNIGVYDRNYITVSNLSGFIYGMEEMNNSIPVLIDEDTPLLTEALSILEEYRSVDMYTDEYEELEENLSNIVDKLSDRFIYRISQGLEGCYNEEYQLDYFLEFYSEARLDGDRCYIDNEDYILKEYIVKHYN